MLACLIQTGSLLKPGQRMMSDTSSEDDNNLWAKLAQTVQQTPSNRRHHTQLSSPGAKPPSVSGKAKPLKQLSPHLAKQAAPTTRQTEIADLRQDRVAGIDRRTAKRMHAGKIAIDATLDLHGLTQTQAHQKLLRFIETAIQNNHRMLLVITGKGQSGHGILRSKLPQWLKQPPLNSYINAIDHAVQRDGGTGAYYIKLRRGRGLR